MLGSCVCQSEALARAWEALASCMQIANVAGCYLPCMLSPGRCVLHKVLLQLACPLRAGALARSPLLAAHDLAADTSSLQAAACA